MGIIDAGTGYKKYYKRILSQTLPLHRYIYTRWFARHVQSTIQWIVCPEFYASIDDLVVLCLVRNGAGYLKAFTDHYIKVGAKHIVFLDNGSTDETIDLAREYGPLVTVVRCTLPYSKYQTSLKYWLAKQFGQGCWCLIADIDERFDFPFSDRITLREFLKYLNHHNYTGVVTQMVDLFAEGLISSWPQTVDVERDCIWFDHTKRVALPFDGFSQRLAGNRYASRKVNLLVGGIRKDAFDIGRPMTKQALIFPGRGAVSITPHWTIHASFADVSCALLHYPFNRDFYEKCNEIVQRNSHWKNSKEYRSYLSVLTETGSEFTFKKPTAKRLENTNQLIDDGHIVVSETYCRYVEELQKKGQA